MVKYSVDVLIEVEIFNNAVEIFLIPGVIVVGTATFPTGSGFLVELWGSLVLRIGRLLWGHTDVFLYWCWQVCTSICIGES